MTAACTTPTSGWATLVCVIDEVEVPMSELAVQLTTSFASVLAAVIPAVWLLSSKIQAMSGKLHAHAVQLQGQSDKIAAQIENLDRQVADISRQLSEARQETNELRERLVRVETQISAAG